MKANFNVAGKEVTVVRRISGVEEYYVNRNLVMKEKMSDCNAVRKLFVDGREVVFMYEFCEPSEYFCQVIVDGEVFIHDLFPGIIESQIIKKSRKFKVIFFIVLVLGIFIFIFKG